MGVGSMDLGVNEDRGDEKMLAVAMPLGSSFGATEGWVGHCETPTPFTGSSYPRDASVASASLSVLPYNADICLSRSVAPGPGPEPIVPVCAATP